MADAPSVPLPAPMVFPTPLAFPSTNPQAGWSGFTDQNFLTGQMAPSPMAPTTGAPSSYAASILIPQMAQSTGMALPTGVDKTDIEQGLAKLATVNPELAQSLAEKYQTGGGAIDDSGGGGFLGFLGDIVHPFVSMGGKVLDVLSSTAYIVPNIVHDSIDGGDLHLGEDFVGAFTGSTRHNWNSVFQELGWDQGGLSGILRAAVGFAGDIATDPLTWLIPTGAGASMYEASAKTAAGITKRVFGAEIDDAVRVLGGSAEDAAKGLNALVEPLTAVESQIAQKVGTDAAERAAGLAGLGYEGATRMVGDNIMELNQKLYSILSTRDTKALSFIRQHGVTLSSGREISGETVEKAIKSILADGNGVKNVGEGAEAWRLARMTASTIGGWRLKFAVPFTSIRYISPFTLPFTRALGFDGLRRFSMGYGGLKRLMGLAVSEADPAKADILWQATRSWTERGFAETAANPMFADIIGSLKSRGQNLGTANWTLSQMAGNLTAQFNSSAYASRAGIVGYWTDLEAKQVKSEAQRFLNDTMNRVTVGGVQYGRAELKNIAKQVGWDAKLPDPARLREQAIWMDGMPRQQGIDGATHFMTNDELEQWWWQQERHQFEEGSAEQASSRTQLDRLKEINGKLTPEEKHAMDIFGSLWASGRSEAGRYELFVHDVTGEFADSGFLHPALQKRWQSGTDAEIAGGNFHVVAGNPEQSARLGSSGVTADTVTDTGDFKGIELVSGPDGGALAASDVPAIAKGGNWVVIDHRPGATLGDQALLEQVDQEFDEGLGKVVNDLGDTHGSGFAERSGGMTRGEARVKGIKAHRPDADGVLVYEADGTKRLYVFDAENVKVPSAHAPQMTSPHSGYFPRFISKSVSKIIHGDVGINDRQRIYTADVLETKLTRETVDMNWEEAEAYIRNKLRAQGVEIPDDVSVLEANPWRAHDVYGQRMAEDIAAVNFGKWTGRLLAMNQIQPYLLGKAAAVPRFEWYLPTAAQKALMAAGAKAIDSAENVVARQAKLEIKEHDAYAKSMERINSLLGGYELGLSPEQLTTQAVAGRTRRAVVSAAQAYEAIQDEVAVTNTTLANLRRRKALSTQGIIWAVDNNLFGGGGAEPLLTELQFRAKLLTGQIKAGADGSLLTKDGAWRRYGTTLDDPSVIDEDIHAMEQRLRELADLDETLKGRLPNAGRGSNKAAGIPLPGSTAVPPGMRLAYHEGKLSQLRSYVEKGIEARPDPADENGRLGVFFHPGETAVPKILDGSLPDDRIQIEFLIPDEQVATKAVQRGAGGGGFQGFAAGATAERGTQSIPPSQITHIYTAEESKLLAAAAQEAEQLPVLGPQTVRKLSAQSAAAGTATATLERSTRAAIKAEQRKFAELGRIRARVQQAVIERNRAVAELRGAEAKTKIAFRTIDPNAVGGGWTALRVPGLEGYSMPAFIASEFHWVLEKHGISGIREMWRRMVLGWWKRWATYRWPGFHVRNFFGAWFNNLLGGVNLKHYGFSWRVTRAMEQKGYAETPVSAEEFARYGLAKLGFSRNVTYGNVADVLSNEGIGRSNTLAVAGTHTMADELNDEAIRGDGNIGKRAFQFYDRHAREWGAGTEAFHRAAAWARGMEISGGDVYSARAFTMLRHGDYGDFTDTEDAVRDLVPFYKWMRTNVPFQIRSLAENPEVMTLPHKAQEAAYAAMGLDAQDERAKMPEWMRQSFAVPIPDWVPFIGSDTKAGHVAYAMLDLPFTDLYKGLTDYLSTGLPIIRNVIESYGISKSLFTGAPLEGRMKPLAGIFALPGISQMLTAVGVAKRGADGQLYIDDRMENVLTAWPIYSRFRNFISGDADRLANRWSSIFSMTAGISVRNQGPEEVTAAEAAFYYEEVYPTLQAYKDMGYTFPTVEEMRNAGMLLEGDATPAPLYALPTPLAVPA